MKVGNLAFFRFRSLNFFILILHGQPPKKKKGKSDFESDYKGEALRESSGKVD